MNMNPGGIIRRCGIKTCGSPLKPDGNGLLTGYYINDLSAGWATGKKLQAHWQQGCLLLCPAHEEQFLIWCQKRAARRLPPKPRALKAPRGTSGSRKFLTGVASESQAEDLAGRRVSDVVAEKIMAAEPRYQTLNGGIATAPVPDESPG